MSIGKDLVAASATPLVLAIVAREPCHGYAILGKVRELSDGALQWTDGMLYPVLHRLEREGFIKGEWERSDEGRRRKAYRITQAGKAQLADQRSQWEAVDQTLRTVWAGLQLSPARFQISQARLGTE
ncbi:MAG: helix-turn-helix transcriptional regulator [Gemmatimonadota bacterium]